MSFYAFSPNVLQTATPIVEKLDPYNMFIQHRLFREATRSVGGQIVKVGGYSMNYGRYQTETFSRTCHTSTVTCPK